MLWNNSCPTEVAQRWFLCGLLVRCSQQITEFKLFDFGLWSFNSLRTKSFLDFLELGDIDCHDYGPGNVRVAACRWTAGPDIQT